jgi:hypothetical protein|tara:strand:- start:186 stop:398 length:213 start_codon:yes stop_codon:yes gene_type:complete
MSQPPAERKYNYTDHRDIESEMIDYILSVADVSSIYSLDLEEINDYLNGLEEYCDQPCEQINEQLLNRSA